MRVLALIAVAATVGALAVGANAAAQQTGTLVVRLVTDPAPPGVTWKYSGAGSGFKLGGAATEHTVALQPGTYQLRERGGRAGQPRTLTALVCDDPSGDTTTSVAQASASVALQDGETVTCTFTHRALGARPTAAQLALARTYAPVLRLSAGEPYHPLRLEDYLGVTTLRSGVPAAWAAASNPPHPLLASRGSRQVLPRHKRGRAELTPLEVSRHRAAPSRISPARDRLLPRRAPTCQGTGRDRVLVPLSLQRLLRQARGRLGRRHGLPPGQQAARGQLLGHQGRRWSRWAAQSTQNGTHPIVYVAYGSHADYSKRGRYRIRVCWSLHGRHCTLTPKADVASGTGAKLAPSGYDLQQLGGKAYTGDWGSGNYILGIGRTSDHVTDPRRRSEYTNPFAVLPG